HDLDDTRGRARAEPRARKRVYCPGMSVLPDPEPLDAAPAVGPPMSPLITLACTLFVGALVAAFVLLHPPSPLDLLDHPAASLERLVTREMDVRAALERLSRPERALYAVFAGLEETPEEAVTWYEELVVTVPSAHAFLYRLILLGEAGRTDRVLADSAAAKDHFDPGRADAAALAAAAYGRGTLDPRAARALVAELRQKLPPNWFADTLVMRIGERAGDPALAAAARSAIEARGTSLIWRWRALVGAELTVVAIGIVGLLSLRPPPFGVAISSARVPPPWTLAAGYALFIRGAFGFLVIGWVPLALLPDRSEIVAVVSFLAGIPLLVLTVRYLHARGLTFRGTFGLGVNAAARPAMIRVSFALIALGFLGEAAIAAGAALLGVRSHWADGFPEELLWASWTLVVFQSVDTVVWTPFFEELAFRGILYGGLRTRLSAGPAVLLSAGIFAVAHGYGPTGGASVLLSGILWALAYERCRSLWPGVIAHAANNLIVNVTYLGLIRLP
ncbi:MAG TPA: type II CAAX endopeptidase family protein, partial [Candidatus Limnocylindrales bacterium]|nr:type II CAAX endopeptidase family protein [Candidatus Limnocylindrales bacterium]